MNIRNTSCGSNCTGGRPGTTATRRPPTTSSAGVGSWKRRATSARKVTPTRSARTVSKLCMAFATVKVTFRRASLNVPVRSRRHAHRLHRAHPPLVPAHDALAPRAGAVGRRLDAGAGHAAVGTVPAVHRRRRRDRGHGGDVPRLQPRPPRRAGASLCRRGRGGAGAAGSGEDPWPRHEQDAERRPPRAPRSRARGSLPGNRARGRGHSSQAAPAARRPPTEGLPPLRSGPLELERWQSTWENRVRYTLSESCVHPLSIQELLGLAGASAAPLLDVRLGYSQSNGTDLLRGRIAALYEGVAPEQILVTTGSAEANFVVCWRLVEPGDRVTVMLPNYLQTWGLAQNFGAQVRGFALRAEAQWEPALEEVRSAIAPGTKLVVVTNPHNPTGHVLSQEMRQAIVSRAAEVGAWLLADEVYQGAERDGATTPSFWGSYERVIVVNGLSKAYGLPGLRIGWVVAPPGF